MAARDYLQRFRPYFAIMGAVVLLLAAGVYVVETLPPHKIVMATGAQGGAYHELGIRYREILAQAGVEVQLLTTTGAIENLTRLRDPRRGWISDSSRVALPLKKNHPGWSRWARYFTSRCGSSPESVAVAPKG